MSTQKPVFEQVQITGPIEVTTVLPDGLRVQQIIHSDLKFYIGQLQIPARKES